MTTLGVVGAGTMGAGIAQLGAAAGMRTLLHDPVSDALERGTEAARRFVRSLSARVVEDRPLSADIEAMASAIRDGSVAAAVEAEVGALR